MKELLYICCTVILLSLNAVSSAQEVIPIRVGNTAISFENEIDTQFVLIDTGSIWHIGTPEKETLSLPAQLGLKAIYTDTSSSYSDDQNASFQFLLYLDDIDYYDISFYSKIHTEQNLDGGTIETSYDFGNTWQNILHDTLIMNHIRCFTLYSENDTIASNNGQPGFTGQFDGSYQIKWDNPRLGMDTLALRFRFTSDENPSDHGGWLLDDFYFGGSLVSIESEKDESKSIIYPNPISDFFFISSYLEEIKNISIYTTNGEIIDNREYIANNNRINISHIHSGVYILKIIYVNGNIEKCKIIKL